MIKKQFRLQYITKNTFVTDEGDDGNVVYD